MSAIDSIDAINSMRSEIRDPRSKINAGPNVEKHNGGNVKAEVTRKVETEVGARMLPPLS